jgi:hypothetical protein
MNEDKSGLIIESDSMDDYPIKKLSFQTKFFSGMFAALLIYHFISSWTSSSMVSDLNAQATKANQEISSLKLQNQKLELALKASALELKELNSNLKYVESARQVKIEEAKDLNVIIEAFKKDLNEGSKLEIGRLERRIHEWEAYLKKIQETLGKRPANLGN